MIHFKTKYYTMTYFFNNMYTFYISLILYCLVHYYMYYYFIEHQVSQDSPIKKKEHNTPDVNILIIYS